jgi:uncharacterized protein (TIGR03067 family)
VGREPVTRPAHGFILGSGGQIKMSEQFRTAIAGRLRVLGIALCTGITLAALVHAQDQQVKIEGDLKTMQGEWTSKDEQGGESVWKFKADHVSLKTPNRGYEMTIKLNPKGEPEKHIDFDVLDYSPNAKGYKAQGIYKFTSDGTLKICFSDGDSGRPKEFKTDFGKSFAFDLKKKK